MKKPTGSVSISISSVSKGVGLQGLAKAVNTLARASVYVGIPKDGRGVNRTDGGPANCVLGYIHEFGSPAAGIPARPFLYPGVRSAADIIRRGFAAAGKAALAEDPDSCMALLDRTGFQTVSAVQNYMRTADFAPLAPSTIANRFRSRKTKSKRPEELKGADHSAIKPLINTASLLRSIQHMVVKE